MNWSDVEIIARGGVPVRKRAWLAATATAGQRVVYVAGAGTTRSVAVMRNGATETVIRAWGTGAGEWGVAEFDGDDWEVAT